MKKITICIIATMLPILSSLGMGDAVAEIEVHESESGEATTTTYKRDGRIILADFELTRDDQHHWHRILYFNEERVARIATINGVTSYTTKPNIPVSVVFGFSEEGELSTVGLDHHEIGAVEGFDVEDGRLKPMKGEDIVSYREVSAAIQEAMGAMRDNRKHNKDEGGND